MYIVSKEFVETLDDWLFKNEKKYANVLKKNKNEIPQMFRTVNNVLYRGMVVSREDAILFREKGIDFKEVTSWTHNRNVAEAFVKDSKYKTTNKGGIGVIISMKIPSNKVILDIFNYVLFSGGTGLDDLSKDSAFKEQEVLVDSIKVPNKSIEFI